MSHQSDWIYHKQPIKFLVFVAGTCNMILLFLSTEWYFETFVFLLEVVTIKTDESVTFFHTVRINKLEANLAARPEKVWTFLFLMYSAAFYYFTLMSILKNGNFKRYS